MRPTDLHVLRRRRGSAAVLGAVVLCGVGCSPPRTQLLAELLAGRTQHLEPSQRRTIAAALRSAEAEFGLDALLLVAVMEEESRYRIEATGRRGGVGLMQIRPATAREVADRLGIRVADEDGLYDPSTNIRLGASYLSRQFDRFRALDLALTAYNAGPREARRARGRGTRPSSRYSARVLGRYETLRRLAEGAGSGEPD